MPDSTVKLAAFYAEKWQADHDYYHDAIKHRLKKIGLFWLLSAPQSAAGVYYAAKRHQVWPFDGLLPDWAGIALCLPIIGISVFFFLNMAVANSAGEDKVCRSWLKTYNEEAFRDNIHAQSACHGFSRQDTERFLDGFFRYAEKKNRSGQGVNYRLFFRYCRCKGFRRRLLR